MTASATRSPPATLSDLVAERRIIVCSGSGGVGKTTLAAVVALEGARLGRKTVVVTIDPARRLADALGLAGLTDTPSRIEGDWPGELWATMLDTKSTFDALVLKHASTPEQGERILANSFYRNISGALSGTQEYMAMEKLYELHEETDFDLVVVDTPPTRHALDFLDAPRRLSRFLEHRLFRLLVAPSRGLVKAVNVAAQTFLRTVSRVVGSDVVEDAIAFFQAFEGMEEGFRQRARRVNELLAAPETAFVLVASPRRDTVEEAQFFADRLQQAGISVEGLVVNRVHPSFGPASEVSAALAAGAARRAETLAGTPIGGYYRNLADFQAVASRERAHLAGLSDAVAPAPVVWVPFLRSDVHDIAGMAAVAAHVFPDAGGTADASASSPGS
ncbi:MAG TPA: ArsA family ATPase [Acidimicrobiales bacterium]